MLKKIGVYSVIGVAILLIGVFSLRQEKRVDFSTEVKPILNKHCISCHGGVKKNGGFSLLFEEEAFAATESGEPAIRKGDAAHSSFIQRLTEDDPELRMPYNAAPLSDDEIDVLRRWVDEGAEWGSHWAYALPESVPVPKPRFSLGALFGGGGSQFPSNIDYFIKERHGDVGMGFSPEAEKETLLRRLHLDIVGLPPTPDQVGAFLNDTRKDAYEIRVDSLLASPHFGERWASWWLDLARYADSKGYERDGIREIWSYRDWVIKAFNANMPFDQFTIEQLAGDLLPEPTKDQLIATAFHRNTMNNDEGGTDNEEFRVAAVMDRLNTTYQVWLSTTFECVQCHSHTYDPFKFEEYYKSYAFFNNTRDEDTYGEHPKLRLYGAAEQQQIDSIKTWLSQYATSDQLASVSLFLTTLEPKYHAHYCDSLENGALADTKWLAMRNGGTARMKAITLDGKDAFYLNYFGAAPGGRMEIRAGSPTGRMLADFAIPTTQASQVISVPMERLSGVHDLYLTFRNPSISPAQAVAMVEWMAFQPRLAGAEDPQYEEKMADFVELLNHQPPSVPIMVENPPDMARTTHVFERGNWLVHGEAVEPAVPEVLNDFPEGAPVNRLGFAQWIVSKDNPLTARTVVNRLWAQLYGRGLVEPLGDMGTQSTPPIHRELLDWLALEFMHGMDWRVKDLLKEMVMARTYRQSSTIDDRAIEKDPANEYFARGPRFRLGAEQIRDQSLAVSGLLSEKMYGPSVMPHQPEGVWMTVYSGAEWRKSEGEDQYRRGIYTFMKRTSPYPSFVTFDASSREVCVVDRIRTNTPLQALTTLNDPVYLEAAYHLGKRMAQRGKREIDAGITHGYQVAMQRSLAAEKKEALRKLYDEAYAYYSANADALEQFNSEFRTTEPGDASIAAFSVVANALINLDEFLTKS
ncbi:DUF1553 domain-containing protein [Parapedobacter soli]|uniref:DUF1553 domain-containing protein n=1 Tax=Parapedobacter soli TaxID=416955 RepID=UPI0021C7FC8A|nr:DUF1553 domain-containing protein [Parapedobacter soli]